ncbi:uncharacterized protein K460DRAFT_409938 [Cucurbitaria berberidis CBS 394.84]|uniref:Uncharacterized protein n=1 Tax=Cucurbitaria berberidis CBS 394.84 TaxID=1168544 RepID=A0A9P4GBI0_9PLEO|nr:uncharacterized protein K460DRAFT_409938 [Cucurbitaria berberidis CBS 394.84]KAF1842535.1 hypothetical protein K460DRAFT_409938 [Cucurbitaria berberidis CBS 394.84]
MDSVTNASGSGAPNTGTGAVEVQDGFADLLATFNAYLDDELFPLPEFTRFMDLPIEIRCNIYEQYFLEEKRLHNEVGFCLLESAHFHFNDDDAFGDFFAFLYLQQHARSLSNMVRKLTLNNVNGQRGSIIYGPINREANLRVTDLSNEEHIDIIHALPRVRELTVTLHAPLLYSGDSGDENRPISVQAIPIDDFLVGFKPEAILCLKELQKLVIVGTSGYCNRSKQVVHHNVVVMDDAKAAHLQAISDLCRYFKRRFTEQGRHVVVTAQLLCSRDGCSEEVFK